MRELRGWSQATMAQKLSEHGFPCHATAVAKLEGDERTLSAEELGAYASALECTTDAVLDRATPLGDRDSVLRRLQGSLDDAARTIRVALRDISDRMTEAGSVDVELIASTRAAVDKLDADALLLAQAAGAVAEQRAGNHTVFRVQRVQWTTDQTKGDK